MSSAGPIVRIAINVRRIWRSTAANVVSFATAARGVRRARRPSGATAGPDEGEANGSRPRRLAVFGTAAVAAIAATRYRALIRSGLLAAP